MIHPQVVRARFLRRLSPVALALALGAQEAPPEALPPVPEAAEAASEAPPETEPAAAIVRFEVDRPAVQAGEWIEFQWETRNAAWVVLEPLGIRLLSTGQLIHRPAASATYWLSAVNDHGGQSWPLPIVVQPARGPFPVQAATLPPLPVPAAPPPAEPAPAVAVVVPAEPGPAVAATAPAEPVPAPAAEPVPAPPQVVQLPAGTPAPAAHGFWVQFGALSTRAAAESLLAQLDLSVEDAITIEVAGPAAGAGRTWYRVHTGPYATRAQAVAKLRDARNRIPARLSQPIVVEGSPAVPDGPSAPAKAKPRHRRSRRG